MKKVIWSVLLTLFLLISPVTANAKGIDHYPRQIILVVDKLSLQDLAEDTMPNLVKLQQQGSIGLMNTNTLGPREPGNTHMTIANGQRTSGGDWAGSFYSVSERVYEEEKGYHGEKAGRLYTSLTGWGAGKDSIVNPGVVEIINRNTNLNYNVKVGALGETLRLSGISRTVIGNSDTNGPRRFGAALIMDAKGRLPRGYIDSSTTIPDHTFPNGLRTDYKGLLNQVPELMKTNSLVVIELGDLSRIDENRQLMTLQRYVNLRGISISRIDDFVRGLLGVLDLSKDQIMLLVPTPSLENANNDNTVTPLIISGGKFKKGGLLTSPSTRRKGFVANTDVGPTILAFYGQQKPGEMAGRPVESLSSKGSLEYLKNFNDKLVLTYVQRAPLLKTTAILEIILILSSLVMIRYSNNRSWNSLFRRFALVVMVLPLVMLYYKYIQFSALPLSFAAVAGVVTLIIIGLEITQMQTVTKFAIISLVTSLSIIIDNITGSSMIMSSPLGYDPMLGGRYYGIGNEFTGILMGSSLLGLAALRSAMEGGKGDSKTWNIPVSLYLVSITVILFAPNFGADAGGVITALASFVYFLFVMNGKRLTPGRALALFLGIVAVLFSGALLDKFFNSSGESHIGLAMGQLLQGGWQEAWNIIARKLSMNWKLIQYSIWSRVLLAALAGLTFLMFYPKGIFKTLEKEYRWIFKGIKAVIVACIVGFIVNDSGVVQAATTAVYIIFPLIYLVMEKKSRHKLL